LSTTCEELSKLSLDLRVISSRLMGSSFEDASDNLKRFLSFVDAAPILRQLIDDSMAHCGREWDMGAIVNQIQPGNPYMIPTDKHEEIAFTYNLLRFILESKREYWRFCYCYLDCGTKLQNYVDKFHRHVVHPFCQHLASHLQQVSIDMGCRGSEALVRIQGDQNQVTIAQGGSTATTMAVFSQEQSDELREAVNKLFASLPQGLLKPHETQDLRALLDEATAQTRTKQPKRWVLTAAVEQLRSLAVRVATEAITKAAADYLLILLGAALAKMM